MVLLAIAQQPALWHPSLRWCRHHKMIITIQNHKKYLRSPWFIHDLQIWVYSQGQCCLDWMVSIASRKVIRFLLHNIHWCVKILWSSFFTEQTVRKYKKRKSSPEWQIALGLFVGFSFFMLWDLILPFYEKLRLTLKRKLHNLYLRLIWSQGR